MFQTHYSNEGNEGFVELKRKSSVFSFLMYTWERHDSREMKDEERKRGKI